jgi:CNT family concentrative nucleoside transporter
MIITIIKGIFGIALIIGVAVLFSNNRRKISWRLVLTGLGIQLFFALFIIYGDQLKKFFFPLGLLKDAISWLGQGIVSLLGFTQKGAEFVFGKLAYSTGPDTLGFYFAFQVLPTIIFVASITSVLYYLGILQAVVKGLGWVMAKLMKTSGAETLSNTANIFVGQTEAPLLVKPYVAKMTQSELLTIMIGGMATVAGGVMASYIQMLGQSFAAIKGIPVAQAQLSFAVHLLAASVMAAPGSLVIAKILFPETGEPMTRGTMKLKVEKNANNVIEAAATGASDGMMLALNVGAMLIAFIAFIYLINAILLGAGELLNLNVFLEKQFGQPLSMQLALGIVLKYLAVGIGVPANDALNFGSLLGTKVVLNEFVAYVDLTKMIQQGLLSQKAITMATYALCGFANFSSLAIQIGGIGPMAPERKKDLAKLGIKAVLGGSLVTLMTATIAGVLIG